MASATDRGAGCRVAHARGRHIEFARHVPARAGTAVPRARPRAGGGARVRRCVQAAGPKSVVLLRTLGAGVASTRRAMMLPRLASILFVVFIGIQVTPANGAVRTIWAVNDGEKVKRDDRQHPARAGNSAWHGRRVLIFGARNEIVAVQLIVQADEEGITRLNVSLPELKTTGGGRIVYRAPAVDPTDSADRPIQIFVEHYMHVSVASHADWVFAPRSPAAPRD